MDDTEWIEINGAKMDRAYFEANIKEAKSALWNPAIIPREADHRHCLVCEIAMSAGNHAFRSSTGWLCKVCFSGYVESGQ